MDDGIRLQHIRYNETNICVNNVSMKRNTHVFKNMCTISDLNVIIQFLALFFIAVTTMHVRQFQKLSDTFSLHQRNVSI